METNPTPDRLVELLAKHKGKEINLDHVVTCRQALSALTALDKEWQGKLEAEKLKAQELADKNLKEYNKLYKDYYDMGLKADAFQKQLATAQAECERMRGLNNKMQKYLRHDMGCGSTVNPRIINDGRCNCSIAKYLGKTEPVNCYHQWINNEFGKPIICSRCGIKPTCGLDKEGGRDE
jgi:hypothetical protein